MWRILTCVLAAGAASAATLESERARVEFDDARGAIVSFIDKQTGRDFIRREGSGLYELTLWDAARTRVTLNDRQAKAKVSTRGRTATIVATHADRKIEVRVECRLDGAALDCGIAVKNGSPLAVVSVRFPAVEFPLRLGESAEDDRALLPKCDGALVENPEANLRGGAVSQYPGSASVQLTAFYDATAGMRASALDGGGHRKSIGVERRGAGLALSLTHYTVIAAGHDFTLPYPVELATFHGDWEAAATEYRQWAVKQKWCRKRLDERIAELPAWLRDMPFFYTMSARGMGADQQTTRYDLIADHVEGYARRLASPVCAMVMAWEKHGAWVTPDYFPAAGGDEAFRALNQRLRAKGNRSLIFLSGLKWTLRKGAAYDSTAAFAKDGEASAIVADTGKTMVVGKPDAGTGEYGELCPATRYAQDLLSGVARHATDLGVTAVQVDQMVGGGGPICYSDRHGHPVGGGAWQAEAVYRLFARLRAEGKQRSQDFAFLIEEPGEYFIPVLDAYHARDYAEGRWPRDGRGMRGAPLFTFIYHDYLLGYGGDSAGISASASAQNIYSAAANLVNGKITAAAVWTRSQPPDEVDGAQRELLASALRLAHGPAREFLLYGERLPTPRLDAPETTIPIWVQSLGKGERRAFPSVLHSLWRLHNGRKGWIAVNVGTQAVEFASPLRGGERIRLEPAAATFRTE
jgi:hypothetical protein